MNGDYDSIFSSTEFQMGRAFEDDPWWCPGFFRVLAESFSEAKFILLTRNPEEWFESLCHHSGGKNPGWSDIHARIYGRASELQALLSRNPGLDPAAFKLLSITEHGAVYQEVYRRHTRDVLSFFADRKDRLYTGSLDDAESFDGICEFVGVNRNPAVPVPHSNQRTADMARRLEAHRRAGPHGT